MNQKPTEPYNLGLPDKVEIIRQYMTSNPPQVIQANSANTTYSIKSILNPCDSDLKPSLAQDLEMGLSLPSPSANLGLV